MANPIIKVGMEIAKEVAQEVVQQAKEASQEIAFALEEIVGEEALESIVNECVNDFCNEVVGELLQELDPELQALAAVIMKHYAREGVQEWTGIELADNGDLSLLGTKENGDTLQVEVVESLETLADIPAEEIFTDLGSEATEKVIFLPEDFYDLPSDEMENIKDKVESVGGTMEVIEKE